jgi:hypothetical protein
VDFGYEFFGIHLIIAKGGRRILSEWGELESRNSTADQKRLLLDRVAA